MIKDQMINLKNYLCLNQYKSLQLWYDNSYIENNLLTNSI